MYTCLPKSYKKKYPFKLGTTSFIYPDHMIPNVKMLSPFVDEIELLMLDSVYDSALPSEKNISELAKIAVDDDISYNVHLPTDIDIADADPVKRKAAVQTMIKVMGLITPLEPSTATIHIPYAEKNRGTSHVSLWEKRAFDSMEEIVSSGVNGRDISVENLDYPFEWAHRIITELDLSVCMDLGHLMTARIDVRDMYDRYVERCPIIHFHGVDLSTSPAKDHISLKRMPLNLCDTLVDILKRHGGTASLEIFSYQHLKESLEVLDEKWQGPYKNKVSK